MTREQINTALDLLHTSKSIRSVILFQGDETTKTNSLPGIIVPA